MKVRIKTIEEMLPDIDIIYRGLSLNELKRDGFQLKDASVFTSEMMKYCGQIVDANPNESLHINKIIGSRNPYNFIMVEGYPLTPLMYEIPTNRNGANS